MIQVMPGATEETITAIEERIGLLGRFSDRLEEAETIESLLDLLVGENNSEILAYQDVKFLCSCSKQRFSDGLKLIGRQEIEAMIEEDHGAETVCHYCNNHYQFTEEELKAILVDVENID